MKPLLKGQKISIDKEINSRSFIVAINWDQSDYPDYEVDTSVLLLSERGKIEEEKDFIFYNNLSSSCGTVKINQEKINNYQRNISIDLSKTLPGTSKILVLLTIDHGAQLNYRFGNINNINFDILDKNTGAVLLSYCIEGLTKETAIIALEIYKHNNEWQLLAPGIGFRAGLDAILREYSRYKMPDEW